MICVTYETSFPMRAATRGSLQLHQLLRLPHKMNVTSDLPHISNVISNARSKWSHPPTSPNATPAIGKWMSPVMCDTYQTSFPMRGASKGSLQPHQILRLPRKMQVINDLRHICNLISTARRQAKAPCNLTKYCACHANLASHQWSQRHTCNLNASNARSIAKTPCNLDQILRLPRKMQVINDLRHDMQPHFQMRGGSKVTVQPHQTLRLLHEILKRQDFSGNDPWMLPPIDTDDLDDNPTRSDDIRR